MYFLLNNNVSILMHSRASLVTQMVKNMPAMQETWLQSLGWEDPLGEGKGYPLQYSGLENSMDYIVHGITKSWTRLSNFHFVLSTSYLGDILGICIQYYLGSLLLLFNHSSCLNSFAKPWNTACQACLSMGFSRHEY